METTIETLRDITIIKIEGDIDWGDETEIQNTVKDLIYRNNSKIIIDFGELNYFSSSTIGIFINLHKIAKKMYTQIVFANLSDFALKLFVTSKLDSLFIIKDSVKEAVESFNQ
ncbi:MAG: STAS domain-containing protein [Candidatus Muiribacteriota bacterium]